MDIDTCCEISHKRNPLKQDTNLLTGNTLLIKIRVVLNFA